MKTRFDPAAVPAAGDVKALENPFMKCMVRVIRARDFYGLWSDEGDADLLAKFTTTHEQRRASPIVGDLDPLILWRLNTFYAAVGVAIEERSNLSVSRTMEISPEGIGRVLFTTKRLVLLSSTLRNVHRFGFNTLRKFADTGTTLVSEAVAVIEAYPDLARA
ncbi:NifX-associated nitrogen fixation protein [Rhizobium leguminosarum]|uniref:NifX-associated nitrogen fixation protein n=1 Tax=Rhizobium ruizarguesonis TaxID=2081791 RepID=A0AAE4YWZ8_9HYPH|nr:NifX-associated nitrogen fixation protein [Rhizobium ruizarguesonis]NEI51813.1 NifX-associated nitrogen fixation protein [Rhizobium ruizarguesonis]